MARKTEDENLGVPGFPAVKIDVVSAHVLSANAVAGIHQVEEIPSALLRSVFQPN